MKNKEGFRLVKGNLLGIWQELNYEKGKVTYSPSIKYEIDKVNVFDHTLRLQRKPYFVDKIDCEALVNVEEFQALKEMLDHPNQLYIEFETRAGTIQRPCVVVKYPKMSNQGRFYSDVVKFSLESVYITYVPINLNNPEQPF